ncbi:cation:proton antiporter [Paenibacillus sp. TRM 82003]|uniref:cation:proton antiporter n=1 Tax=Kineococcus sp. TRM81007 TaxID=2925831 RepID=UPI001F5934AD|nr:cation:proton antiporter [Kineococcus sp. TRM81007]MCI2237934.1 cation:proton antiporter [Kineococcus sp. TRM81007]MCI3925948.1 cation:proton antiporter [Paenibacillus sp. TRM 82003]
MSTPVLLVVTTAVVALAPAMARRVHLPAPSVLFLLGCALAVLPLGGQVHLEPEFVLLVLLPVILYWEGYTTSVQHAWRYRRAIVLTAVPLVIATAAAVAVTAHAWGSSWAAAWILGAVLAPTDASAVAAYARALPLRLMTILRGESLINDGTALVLLGIAISAAQGAHVSVASAAGELAWAYAGGIAAGALVAAAGLLAVRRTQDPSVLAAVSVAEPFAASVLAEAVHASGVVAVVTCALGISRSARRAVPAHGRLQVHAFWETTSWLVNGSLFVLVGLEARSVFDAPAVDAGRAGTLIGQGLLLAALLMAVRVTWLFLTAWLVRLVDRRPVQRELRVPWRLRLVAAWSGMRGGTSLAAALSVPLSVEGAPFPERDVILVLTFVVVGTTLLVQGATLPLTIGWVERTGERASSARCSSDGRAVGGRTGARPAGTPPAGRQPAVATGREEEVAALAAAIATLSAAVDEHLQRAVERDPAASGAVEVLRRQVHPTRTALDGGERELLQRLQHSTLQREREVLAALVARGELEDTQMWRLQERLDLDEALLLADRDLPPAPAPRHAGRASPSGCR